MFGKNNKKPTVDLKNTKTIGDKKTLGTKNVRFFWNSQRYYAENIYHAIATSCLILFCFLFVLIIVLTGCKVPGFITMNTNDQQPSLAENILLFVCFFSMIGFAIMKLSERKVRKQRMADFANSYSREIGGK